MKILLRILNLIKIIDLYIRLFLYDMLYKYCRGADHRGVDLQI